ncbi:MAG: tetratricopeptide repeat protein [Alphaproteobacteria bacterium]
MNRHERRTAKKKGGNGSGGNGRGGGDPRLNQAMALHQAGRLMEADGFYRQVLEDHPTHPDALRLRGALALQIGNPGAAVELLSAARKADPNNAEVLSVLALALERGGNIQAAEQAYRRALSMTPKAPDIWNNLGALLRDAGRLTEAAEAFGKAAVLKPDYVEALGNLAVTLFRMEKLDASLAAFQAALDIDPGDIDLLLNYGVVLSTAGRAEEAAACFADVAEQAPDDPDALTNLTAAQMRLEDLAGAEETARRALELAPDSAGALANLAMVLSAARHFEEAEGYYQDALRTAPDFADVWSNYGNLLMASDRLDEAEVAYSKARTLSPSDARHSFQLGLLHLNRGELDRGWTLYEAGLDCGERVPIAPPGLKRWDGQPFGGRLLIAPEQGIGDELRALSLLPDVVKAAGPQADVIVGCDARLSALIERSFDGARTVTRDEAADVTADAQVPAASLMKLFRPSLASFPDRGAYLKPDPNRVAAIRTSLDRMPKGMTVGIAWRSGLSRLRTHTAVTELAAWQPVFDVSGVRFVNLQYGATPAELDATPVHQLEDIDLFNDIDGAAAATHACDLVINMGTSAGDLAGALGVPCWSLMLKPAWVTLGSEGHPFYPRTEIFWRLADDEWSDVLARVAERLAVVVNRWQG